MLALLLLFAPIVHFPGGSCHASIQGIVGGDLTVVCGPIFADSFE